ncbi:hypothetical protein [Aeromicrobium fastidiosum]|uniref:Uncharacterized protein n=1 Tax=Aeromicrobium fastidiosum TaxID=52699 RepID=A0A641AUL2_9ACTN|nr:hypothetical protein [Aeromicrobium fastidiosum]KAA1380538.1 hypothetical protein ESP62_005000 [Aeromicrobium fastidiosum]MBP2390131.1 hypothetical protein [Aeromicrobium fastidiosum]
MSPIPSVRFALPGRWLKAELDDPAAVSALSDMLPDGGREADAWLDSLRAAGAKTLLLRVQSSSAAAIVFIWPPGESHGDASAAGVRTRLGLDGETVPNGKGYTVVRDRRAKEGSEQDVVTYGVAHPETGRILVVRCMAFDHTFEPLEVEDFDLAAANLTWDET